MAEDKMGLDELKHRVDPEAEIQALRRERKALRAELAKQKREYGDLRSYFTDVREAVEPLTLSPAKVVYVTPKKSRVGSPCSAVAQWTDWHYGAVQDADEIEGFASFSPEQLESRIINFTADFLGWIEMHRYAYTINELVLLCTGDLISGDIHDELRITNAWPTPVQACRCGKFLAESVARMSPHFESVRVEFIVADNHARLVKRPQAKQEGMNTHNYTVGFIAKELLREHKNVQFNLYPMNEKVVNVANQQYLICHGHGVMGWAGVPYYGIDRKVSKEAKARMWKPDNLKFHKMITGHWHAPATMPWWWIGGSAQGTDAYDHKEGRDSPPIQSAWLVHPKKTEFNRTEFLLRDE